MKHFNQPQIIIQMEEGECKQTTVTPYLAYSYFGNVYLVIKLLYINKSIEIFQSYWLQII